MHRNICTCILVQGDTCILCIWRKMHCTPHGKWKYECAACSYLPVHPIHIYTANAIHLAQCSWVLIHLSRYSYLISIPGYIPRHTHSRKPITLAAVISCGWVLIESIEDSDVMDFIGWRGSHTQLQPIRSATALFQTRKKSLCNGKRHVNGVSRNGARG